jgi:hypothetical protein
LASAYSDLKTTRIEEIDFNGLWSGGSIMLENRISPKDRRSGNDRRKAFYGIEENLSYFRNGGRERRSWLERRSTEERRAGWMRVDNWSSVLVEEVDEEG